MTQRTTSSALDAELQRFLTLNADALARAYCTATEYANEADTRELDQTWRDKAHFIEALGRFKFGVEYEDIIFALNC